MSISVKEFMQLPDFHSQEEAINHFRKRYGENFIVTYSNDTFSSHPVHYCYLLSKDGDTQTIQIYDDGLVEADF